MVTVVASQTPMDGGIIHGPTLYAAGELNRLLGDAGFLFYETHEAILTAFGV